MGIAFWKSDSFIVVKKHANKAAGDQNGGVCSLVKLQLSIPRYEAVCCIEACPISFIVVLVVSFFSRKKRPF